GQVDGALGGEDLGQRRPRRARGRLDVRDVQAGVAADRQDDRARQGSGRLADLHAGQPALVWLLARGAEPVVHRVGGQDDEAVRVGRIARVELALQVRGAPGIGDELVALDADAPQYVARGRGAILERLGPDDQRAA